MIFKRTVISIFFLFVLMASADAQRWDGRWKGEMQTPQDPVEILFEFQTDGKTLTGAAATPAGIIPLTDGVVDGNKITFTLKIDNFDIEHTGYYIRSEIRLTTKFEGEEKEFILKRADR
ncbi:MAG: hypothetical protein JJ895_07735 [Balneolaceae bacterium]|nr:hypothetical protein [Balneolaceae bacterium]